MSLGLFPRYFSMSSELATLKKVAEVWFATALASKVLPILDLKRERKKMLF